MTMVTVLCRKLQQMLLITCIFTDIITYYSFFIANEIIVRILLSPWEIVSTHNYYYFLHNLSIGHLNLSICYIMVHLGVGPTATILHWPDILHYILMIITFLSKSNAYDANQRTLSEYLLGYVAIHFVSTAYH